MNKQINTPLGNFVLREGKVSSFGWVRRQELCTTQYDIWESPEGIHFASDKDVEPVISVVKKAPSK